MVGISPKLIQEAAEIIIKNCSKLQLLEQILFLIEFTVIPPTVSDKGIEEGGHCTFSVTEDGCPHWTIAIVPAENESINTLMTKLMHELCHVKQTFCLIEVLMEKGLSQEEACFEAEKCWRRLHYMFEYWDHPLEKYAYSFQEFGTAYYLDTKTIMKKMVMKRLGI